MNEPHDKSPLERRSVVHDFPLIGNPSAASARYFVGWRIVGKRKMEVFDCVGNFLDSNVKGTPRLATGDAIRVGLRRVAGGTA